ncbi:MAG: poly-gamma-glutamate biosynthesis protein PgsC/CapC [Myxococcota bacterium]|nr:poly-gamma-glutamate biosynthesis protein PgsC/CapC [Myxococcota bacterium]
MATLTLFPPYSLDTSILVAVLVGVLALALLTETLGWVFVGLVVPGYLASVFVIHPEAGLTVTFEAVLTYLLAVALSKGLSRTGAWSEFFGRERFFLVVLASVLVRAVSEAWLLPTVGGLLDQRYGTAFALDRTLHSIGLVLVPLTANAFWKLQLRRGLLQVAVPVAVTYLVLQLILLPYTNLSFSSLELTYEDIAQSFLASPKAYIILLTTAILAARFNLKYGWDFNGILVPALIALTWMTPGKLVATGLEVLVLVLGTQALLRIPGLSTMNLEGPRKTVLVFAFGFAVKWGLGWFFGGRVPGLKVTDLFGFGYLVPALLAVKILQKKVVVRTLLATAHTSFAGVVVGSLIGFALSLIEPRPAVAEQDRQELAAPSLGLSRTPLGVMAIARATARESGTEARPLPKRRGELRRYGELWKAIDPWLVEPTAEAQASVEKAAAALSMRLEELPPTAAGLRQFALLERTGAVGKIGWDTAILIPGAPGPVLEIPRPAYEAPAAEAATVLCARVACRSILASGVDTRLLSLKQGDAVITDATPFHTAHVLLEAHPRVVIRADGRVARRGAQLHLPPTLSGLEALWPTAQSTRDAPPDGGLAWAGGDTAILRVNPDDLAQVVVEGTTLARTVDLHDARSLISTPSSWKGPLLPEPTSEELLVLEHQVASILLDVHAPRGRPQEPSLRVLWAARMAELFGLSVREVAGCGEDCFLVLENSAAQRVGAGILVRAGAEPLALEAPVPDRENGVLELSFEMLTAADARAVVFAGPPLGYDAAAPHPAVPGNGQTSFEAFHQAAHRALPTGAVLQLRGYGSRPGLDSDVLVDLDRPVLDDQSRPQQVERLFASGGPLHWLSDRVRYFEGGPEQVGFGTASPQQGFSRAYGGAQHATLWLSDKLRGAYVEPRRAANELGHVGLGAFPLTPMAVEDALGMTTVAAPRAPTSAALEREFEALMLTASRAVREQNIHDLASLARVRSEGRTRLQIQTFWSPRHALPYLLVEAKEGRRVLRGIQFLQSAEASTPPLRLDARAPEADEGTALELALRMRGQVVVTGDEAVGGSRR